jgi:hypothetical protein
VRCSTTTSVAAYALGTLDTHDRDDVAAHLPTCAVCRTELAELAGLPALLRRVRDDVPPAQPDPGVLDRVLAAAAAETDRHRRRVRVVAVAAAAAVVLALGGAGLAVRGHSSPGATTVAGQRGAVHASVQLRPAHAGTDLALDLGGVAAEQECRLVAVTADGTRDVAATWQAGYTGQVTILGRTRVPADRIQHLVVETLDRQVLLDLPTG